ncbi:MAG TPA: glucose-6-phosphate dehydrogenase (coenzyme-F420) [Candidatus Limnocylindrales bacterium]|nr:glucose-6-phosphate dehydrogenase (coenzyme-F420) [Candidatus Limnocylindrales bacterium]
MLTLGWKASAEQFAPRELLELGVAAERHGFDSVVVSDHFHPWRDTGGHAPFSFAWLGAVGARTERVRLGTSVVTPTFRYHPAIVAQAAATLACLAPDRFFLGVGSGEAMNEVPVTGAEWPPPGERLARLAEAVALIRRLWSEGYVTHEGKFFRTREAKIFDKPERPVPLLVAAAGPKAAEQAGRDGDGLICTSGKGPELYRDTLLPAFAKGAKAAGKDPERLERMIEMKVSFDTDRARALEDTKEWAALALPGEEKAGVEDPREMERRAKAAEPRAHTRFIVSTDPDEHCEKILEYVALGFDHLVFHFPGGEQERAMALYEKEILPRLRRRG